MNVSKANVETCLCTTNSSQIMLNFQAGFLHPRWAYFYCMPEISRSIFDSCGIWESSCCIRSCCWIGSSSLTWRRPPRSTMSGTWAKAADRALCAWASAKPSVPSCRPTSAKNFVWVLILNFSSRWDINLNDAGVWHDFQPACWPVILDARSGPSTNTMEPERGPNGIYPTICCLDILKVASHFQETTLNWHWIPTNCFLFFVWFCLFSLSIKRFEILTSINVSNSIYISE